MKLYTEEQVRHLADCIHGADTEKILASLTPSNYQVMRR